MAAARLLVSHGLADTGNPCGGLVRREESSASLRKDAPWIQRRYQVW